MANVLVVDDDIEVLDTIATMVMRGGHTVITACDGRKALDVVFSCSPIDLMVTDVVMPALNGFNLVLVARLRRPALRILFLTGFADQALRLRDPLDRIGKLLIKPIMPADLCNEVDVALAGDAG